MKLSKDAIPGAAIASLLLHERLLDLIIDKKILSRDEVLEHVESVLLSAEELQSSLDAAQSKAAAELSLRAVRSHIEGIRLGLEVRHPR